jgi:hypothetical protein
MNEIRVTSWGDLFEQLFEGSWQPDLGRFRSHSAFRGVSSSQHRLVTTLAQLGGNYAELEGHLLRNFRKYAYRAVTGRDFIWNWLAVAQHHGLPTRLLDWTYSPYVALHFATENLARFDQDAVIWCVDFVRTNALLPAELRAILEEEGSDVFTAEMLLRAAESLPEFDALAPAPFVVFMEPPSLDDRIVNQYALFSIMNVAEALLDQWLEARPDLYRRIIVPRELKWEVRDKLDQGNITERVLFPGLDGLSRWLKRQYTPKPPVHR